MKKRIYFDNSATTRVDEQVLETVDRCMRDSYGNAGSIHAFGQEARAAVEEARRSLADLIGADTREVIFTSGGTESDNMALWGVFRSGYRPGNHIVTTRIEHPAILSTCKELERAGAEVTYVGVDASGRVDPAEVEAAVNDRTILISVMHANNETGVIQPIEEISAIARAAGIVMHTDAVQSAGKVPLNVGGLAVDLLSLSGHKFHAPKGIGALWVGKGARLAPFMTGGSQERKRRAGTENVPGIAGLGVAARLAAERLAEMGSRVAALRNRLESEILGGIPGALVNGAGPRIPTITNISFAGLEAEAAVIAMDLEGLAVSTGSACSSGSLEPSHVLKAMRLRPAIVQSSLRFSLGYYNTEQELDGAIEVVSRVTNRLRKLSRNDAPLVAITREDHDV